jgi:riboflavin synthase
MFTGIVQEIGAVLWIRATDRGTQLQVAAPLVAKSVHTGGSVAVNGCCLTVSNHRGDQITFDLLEETLTRTNLKQLRRDSLVNLELPLSAADRFGGHFVQGHVDCATRVLGFEQNNADYRLEVELPNEFAHYVAYKGSVAINGVSLTVAQLNRQSFATWIIPHTRRSTNLAHSQPGDLVNIEFDILAKYVERMAGRYTAAE